MIGLAEHQPEKRTGVSVEVLTFRALEKVPILVTLVNQSGDGDTADMEWVGSVGLRCQVSAKGSKLPRRRQNAFRFLAHSFSL